jgi:hypothetical protein
MEDGCTDPGVPIPKRYLSTGPSLATITHCAKRASHKIETKMWFLVENVAVARDDIGCARLIIFTGVLDLALDDRS